MTCSIKFENNDKPLPIYEITILSEVMSESIISYLKKNSTFQSFILVL